MGGTTDALRPKRTGAFFVWRLEVRQMAGQGQGVGFALRVWMWFVPIAMLVASVVFGAIAAANGSWGLLAVMVFLGMTGLGLLLVHWWLLYRFGVTPEGHK